jgi:hypothetical protein
VDELPMTLAQWKKANPEITKYISPKYKKYRKDFFKARRENETDGGDNVKIEEIPAKIVKDMNAALNPPEPMVRLDFNVEVEAVLKVCDENITKVHNAQGAYADTVSGDDKWAAVISLEEVKISLQNIKLLTTKMLASYKDVDEGIAMIEKKTFDASVFKARLAALRTQTEKPEVA